MKIIMALPCAVLAVLSVTSPTFAENHTPFEMPTVCQAPQSTGGMDHSAMGHGSPNADASGGMATSDGAISDATSEHILENMRRMKITMPAMEEGMMKEDADVAFACAMIAHHQGAIDMAEVLLEFGDDPQMIDLAKNIIAAQVGEIEQMTAWLSENAK